MWNRENYNSLAILREFLRNSSAESVCNWFKQEISSQDEQDDLDGFFYRIHRNWIDEDCEHDLLNRKERLIDLNLAMYGNRATKILYQRAQTTKDETLLIACLMNYRASWDEQELSEALQHIALKADRAHKKIENILFSNIAFLRLFVQDEMLYTSLTEKQKYLVVAGWNRKLKAHKRGFIKAIQILRSSESEALWALSAIAPTTERCAQALGEIYQYLKIGSNKYYNKEKALLSIKRWHVTEKEIEKWQKKYDEIEFWRKEDDWRQEVLFHPYILIKAGLYRNVLYDENLIDDIAYRAAALYQDSFCSSPDEITLALKKDGEVAIKYFASSKYAWRRKKARITLRKFLTDYRYYSALMHEYSRLEEDFEESDLEEVNSLIEEYFSEGFIKYMNRFTPYSRRLLKAFESSQLFRTYSSNRCLRGIKSANNSIIKLLKIQENKIKGVLAINMEIVDKLEFCMKILILLVVLLIYHLL